MLAVKLHRSSKPRLFLGRKLPDSCIKWTKDLRLLYHRPARREKGIRPPAI